MNLMNTRRRQGTATFPWFFMAVPSTVGFLSAGHEENCSYPRMRSAHCSQGKEGALPRFPQPKTGRLAHSQSLALARKEERPATSPRLAGRFRGFPSAVRPWSPPLTPPHRPHGPPPPELERPAPSSPSRWR